MIHKLERIDVDATSLCRCLNMLGVLGIDHATKQTQKPYEHKNIFTA